MVNSRKSENVSCAVSILYLAQQDQGTLQKKGKEKMEERMEEEKREGRREREKEGRRMRDEEGREHMQDGNYPLHRVI